jgi:hypothetical protein
VALGLLDEHMAHCVIDAAEGGGPDADAKLKEAIRRHRQAPPFPTYLPDRTGMGAGAPRSGRPVPTTTSGLGSDMVAPGTFRTA